MEDLKIKAGNTIIIDKDISFLKIKTEEQIDILVEMAEEIWTEHFGPILKNEKILKAAIDANQSKNVILEQLGNKYQYYFIKNEDKVIGYFAYKLNDADLFISKLYLLSSERRKGVGRLILNYLQELAHKRNLRTLSLTVYYENTMAINAYKKNDFKIIETIIRDFGEGVICIDYRMEKELK